MCALAVPAQAKLTVHLCVCARAFVLRYNHLDFEVQYRAEELTGADLMAVLEQGEEVPPTNATILGFKVTPRR